MYQDDLVCILKPHEKRYNVWTNFTQPYQETCKLGLKQGKKLKRKDLF